MIANLAHTDLDDRWTALDARPLYAWLSPVGHLYEAQLRWELTRRAGVAWGPVRNGIADIAGIPQSAIDEFSTRRHQIEAHLESHGQYGARAAQVATYATRQAKDQDLDADDLITEWRTRAVAAGLTDWVLDRAVRWPPLVRAVSPDRPDVAGLYGSLASPDGLTRSTSAFGRRDVIKAMCNALPNGAPVTEVLGLVDGFLASRHVVGVRVEHDQAVIRRDDGTVIAARTDQQRWTTPEMLAIEAHLLESADRRRHTDVAVAAPDAVDSAIAARGLSTEQEAMVRSVCQSGDGVEIVEGVAGSGKTFALGAARQAWQACGYEVTGCSLAARAAKQLHDGAGIRSVTVDRLLGDLDRPGGRRLDAGDVVVVDEAAMVGTRKLDRLLGHAEQAGAKVVLVGDPRQLPEIEAGGAFAALQQGLGGSQLTDNRRQTAVWERDALGELRAGDPGRALDSYVEQDRVHLADSDDHTRNSLIDAWLTARHDGQDAVMVAARLTDVDDLNRRARHALREDGQLGTPEVEIGGRAFARGDEVLALLNDYRLGLLNGARATIDHIDTDRHQLEVFDDQGEQYAVPYSYAGEHLTHGYATTIHKAQGATVDRCFVLADDTLHREHAYTALSRGRHGNDLYVTRPERRVDERHTPEIEPDPLDTVRHAVTHSTAKHLAHQTPMPVRQPVNVDPRDERDRLRERLAVGRPEDHAMLYQDLSERHAILSRARDEATAGRDTAQHELDRLGPIRRRLHPTQRQALGVRLADAEREVVVLDGKVAALGDQLDTLAPRVAAWNSWANTHAQELQRLDLLDQQIRIDDRMDAIAHRSPDRTIEHDIGLGIEL